MSNLIGSNLVIVNLNPNYIVNYLLFLHLITSLLGLLRLVTGAYIYIYIWIGLVAAHFFKRLFGCTICFKPWSHLIILILTHFKFSHAYIYIYILVGYNGTLRSYGSLARIVFFLHRCIHSHACMHILFPILLSFT